MNKIIEYLPKMKSSEELISALEVLPDYSVDICNEDSVMRLVALSDLYKIYIPSFMSVEIYSKLYLSLIRSLNKKNTKLATIQQNENFKAVLNQEYRGIIGGSDSFTIIGNSGIGKSSAISRAIELITENKVIETTSPYSKIIPCVTIQCPFDSSVKGLLLEILRKVDEEIESSYYEKALRARATTDMLIGSVSQVALNHIGLLIVDEIQNVVNSKNGKSLVGALTQLINNSGISICMVGTPESNIFFEQAMQLARRSLGLQYGAMKYDDAFREFCRTVFKYQYTKNKVEISESIVNWIYEHSGGIASVVVSLIHDAQEIAILNGSEKLDLDNLSEAYKKRLSLLHGYIEPQKPLRTILKKKDETDTLRGKNVSEGLKTLNTYNEDRMCISIPCSILGEEVCDIIKTFDGDCEMAFDGEEKAVKIYHSLIDSNNRIKQRILTREIKIGETSVRSFLNSDDSSENLNDYDDEQELNDKNFEENANPILAMFKTFEDKYEETTAASEEDTVLV